MSALGETIIGDPKLQRVFFDAIRTLRNGEVSPERQKEAFLTAAMAWPLNLSPDQYEAFKKNIRHIDKQVLDKKFTTWIEEGGTVLSLSLHPGRDASRWVLERIGTNGDTGVKLVWSVGDQTHLASVTYTGPEGHLKIDYRWIITTATEDLAKFRLRHANVPRLISSMACLSVVPDILGALAKRD